MSEYKKPLLVVLGPTASGKTKLAVNLANTLNGEIVSADSRQVFEGMDIGTGKDLDEYVIADRKVPYHLINIRQAGDSYNVNEFKEDFYSIFTKISDRNLLPVLCGGSGMYIHSIFQDHQYTAIPPNHTLRASLSDLELTVLRELLSGYSHKFRAHADLSSRKRVIRAIEVSDYLSSNTLEKKERPAFDSCVVGLAPEIDQRRKKIIDRLSVRLKKGLIEEVEELIASGVSKDKLIFYGLEYKFVVAYLSGKFNYNELQEKLTIAICQFAKRQMTFFRKMEKDGVKINWIDSPDQAEQFAWAMAIYNGHFNNPV
ncbi:tRNA (adenosine(37)-N6)-dimethylallyltransferase MiaA [Pedobacter africanus]|nr:tRNA (adenosine(37)-N6)-dimethylallyltransferase MiaA [Pedobacter africanus]